MDFRFLALLKGDFSPGKALGDLLPGADQGGEVLLLLRGQEACLVDLAKISL